MTKNGVLVLDFKNDFLDFGRTSEISKNTLMILDYWVLVSAVWVKIPSITAR